MLFAIQGHFDATEGTPDSLLGSAPSRKRTIRSRSIGRKEKGAKDMAYVLFDARRFCSETRRPSLPVLERNHFAPPAPEPGSILARAAEMDAATISGWSWTRRTSCQATGWRACSVVANGRRRRRDSKRVSICARA